MAEYAMSDHEKRKKIQELLDAAKAVLKTGRNPVFRCVDRENEKKIELELSLKAQKEAALADAERKLEEYQRGLLNRE